MKNIRGRLTQIFLFACLLMTADGVHAATWTVTKIQDTHDGVCDVDCSLREAVDGAAAGDTVVFSSLFNTPQTIGLLTPFPNNGIGLTVSRDLTIQGPGADLLTLFGINTRVFDIPSGTVYLGGMTIGGGLGIVNYGSAETIISECVLTNSYHPISNSAVMTILNSTITENLGFDPAVSNSGELTLLKSTVSFNNSGGIENEGSLAVTNSTVSGNSLRGIENTGGSGTITGSTIVYNFGEGLRADAGTVTVRNSIIAETMVINGNDVRENFSGVIISGGYNLIGADGASLFAALGDQTGNFLAPLDPMLDPLADYGGMTDTHRLRTNSTAIDKGDSFGLVEDQRGYTRPFDKPSYPNAPGGDGSDIGAYELQFTIGIAGAVYNYLGFPIKNTRVTLRASTGELRAVRTDRFGIYVFKNVARNRIYQINVTHRQLDFTPQIVMAKEENISGLNFTALP